MLSSHNWDCVAKSIGAATKGFCTEGILPPVGLMLLFVVFNG